MRPRLVPSTLALVALLGCGSPPAGDGPDAGSGPACPHGADPANGACEETLTWSAGPLLPKGRDHHATVAATLPGGSFLFVLGGTPDHASLLRDVLRAPIGADGALGSWTPLSPLPLPLAGPGVALVGRTLVLTGGFTAGPLSTRTLVAHLADDGALSDWTDGPALPSGRFHHALVAHGQDLINVGGFVGTTNTGEVLRARVTEAGALEGWTPLTALPQVRSHHAAVATERFLYVVGGLRGNPSSHHTNLADVLRAEFQPDGTLGAWSTLDTQLPVALGTHSAFVHGGFLWVVGGIEDEAVFTNHVWRAPLLADGTLGAFRAQPDLPLGRAHVHQTPVVGAFVYSAGGSTSEAHTTNQTSVGHLE